MSNPLKQTTMLTRHVPGYIWSARTVTWYSDAVRCVAVNRPTSGVAVPPVPPHSTKVHQPFFWVANRLIRSRTEGCASLVPVPVVACREAFVVED